MKTNLTFWHLLTLLLLVLPSLYLAFVWSALPSQIPTHFDINGQPNGYTAKESMWWLCAALPFGIYGLLTWLPRFDPKRRWDSSTVNFQKLRLTLIAGLSGLSCVVLYGALHPGILAEKGLIVILAGFFALLGNYLTTVRPNYFVGIKTPWALEFPVVWEKTHRLGGRLFFVTGLIAMVATLLLSARVGTWLLVGGVGAAAVLSYAYSYWVYRQEVKLTMGK